MKSLIGSAALALLIAGPAAAQQANLGLGGSISGAAAPASTSFSIGSGINTSISQSSISQASISQAGAPADRTPRSIGRTVDLTHSRVATNADTTIDKARQQPDSGKPAAPAPVQGPSLDGH